MNDREKLDQGNNEYEGLKKKRIRIFGTKKKKL